MKTGTHMVVAFAFGALLAVIIVLIALFLTAIKQAQAGQAPWYVVEWYPTRIAITPQKTHDECKRMAAERARKNHAACFSHAEKEALKSKEKKK